MARYCTPRSQVVYQARQVNALAPALPDSHFQGVQGQVSAHWPVGGLPDDDPPRVHVSHENHIDPGPATSTCTPPSTASPAWPTPRPSTIEKASTTIGFFYRARTFLAAHGVTRLVRVVTDNGANYRAQTFTTTITSLASRHQRIRPYTPRHNGKVERYNNRILAEECLYARSYTSQQQRHDAVAVVEPTIQLPSTPHRLPQPATHHPRPNTHHQPHDLIHLGHASD